MAQSSISDIFTFYTRHLYFDSLNDCIENKKTRIGINCATEFAIPAYITSVAGLEAFINEVFLSDINLSALKNSDKLLADKSDIEYLGLVEKIVRVVEVLLDMTLKKGERPLQDLSLLVKLRNMIVHYKWADEPKFFNALSQRGIVLPYSNWIYQFAWSERIQCSEGVRWAHNTICNTVHHLVKVCKDNNQIPHLLSLSQNFRQINRPEVKDWFISKGININEEL